MSNKSSSEERWVRKSADQVHRSTREELQRLVDLPDEGINFSDIPQVSPERMRAMGAARRLRFPAGARPGKQRVTMMLNRGIVQAFKSQGPGYQTRINEVLLQFLLRQSPNQGAQAKIRQARQILEMAEHELTAAKRKRAG